MAACPIVTMSRGGEWSEMLVAAWRSMFIFGAVAMISEVAVAGQTGAGRTVFDLAA
jgi:hypothetical protein